MVDFSAPLVTISFFVGLTFVIAGYLLKHRPPKKINGIYGYRTPRSMMSQKHWDFAQTYAGHLMLNQGILLIMLSVIGLFIPTSHIVGTIISMGAMFIGIIFLMVNTENELKNLD